MCDFEHDDSTNIFSLLLNQKTPDSVFDDDLNNDHIGQALETQTSVRRKSYPVEIISEDSTQSSIVSNISTASR
jgi:hypothetical protein